MPTLSQYPRDDRVDAAQEIALGDPSAERLWRCSRRRRFFLRRATHRLLAVVRDPAAIGKTAVALEIRSDNPLPTVIVAVSDKHLLLLLDNCEHGIDAAHPQSLSAAIVALAAI